MTRMLGRGATALAVLALAACTGTGGGSGPPTQQAPIASPGPAASPTASAATTSASSTPSQAATPSQPAEDGNAVPSRVVVPELDIDLPVISGATFVEGNPPDYPLCDVAQYLTTYRYPGRPETTTWIYAHAREGMFLPLLDASLERDGASLVGQEVLVYSTEPRLYRYRIDQVEPHALTRALARAVPAGGRRLVLQTSEGPRGTVPKLQVGALLESSEATSDADALPSPSPVVCYLP